MEQVNNITTRKQQTMIKIKSRSMESLEHSFIDTSLMSCDEILGRSLDLSSNICSTYMLELKAEIKELKSQLESTQNEMENIVLENLDLKKQVLSMNQELGVLKQLCRSPLTAYNHNVSSASKRSVRRRLTSSFCVSPLKPNDITNTNKGNSITIKPDTETKTEQPSTSATLNSNFKPEPKQTTLKKTSFIGYDKCADNPASTKTQQNNIKSRKYNVLILTDEQESHIGGLLRRDLGADYEVLSIIKPKAPTDEIVNSCISLSKNFDERDFVIILTGTNDDNPITMQSFLHYNLFKISHTNVLVGNVHNARYINSSKINSILNLISDNLKHVHFIDSGYRQNTIIKSRLFLREILRIQYRNNYMKYCNNIVRKNIISWKTEKSNLTSSTNNIVPRKGTIPHYFQSVPKSLPNIFSEPSNTQTCANAVQQADDFFRRY